MTFWTWIDVAFTAIWLIALAFAINKYGKLQKTLGGYLVLPAEHQVRNSPYRGPFFSRDKITLYQERVDRQLSWLRVLFVVLTLNMVTSIIDILMHR